MKRRKWRCHGCQAITNNLEGTPILLDPERETMCTTVMLCPVCAKKEDQINETVHGTTKN